MISLSPKVSRPASKAWETHVDNQDFSLLTNGDYFMSRLSLHAIIFLACKCNCRNDLTVS